MAGAGGSTSWERLDYLKTLPLDSLCRAVEIAAEGEPTWFNELRVCSIEDMEPAEVVAEMSDELSEYGWHLDTFKKMTSEDLEFLIKGNEGDSVKLESLRNVSKEHIVDFIMAVEEAFGVSISAH